MTLWLDHTAAASTSALLISPDSLHVLIAGWFYIPTTAVITHAVINDHIAAPTVTRMKCFVTDCTLECHYLKTNNAQIVITVTT